MKKAVILAVASALVATPLHAAEWNDARYGTFVGAHLTIGGKSGARPRAALAIAPTQSRISSDGRSSMGIGEGLAFNLTPGARPTLTLAGMRADRMLRLNPSGDVDADRKLGVSTGGWVAIGLGVAAVAGGAFFVHLVHEAEENSE